MLHILVTIFFAVTGLGAFLVIFLTLQRHSDDLDFLMQSHHESKARQKELSQNKNSLDCN